MAEDSERTLVTLSMRRLLKDVSLVRAFRMAAMLRIFTKRES